MVTLTFGRIAKSIDGDPSKGYKDGIRFQCGHFSCENSEFTIEEVEGGKHCRVELKEKALNELIDFLLKARNEDLDNWDGIMNDSEKELLSNYKRSK